ncbi:MAG: tetraacyldisaccharide 4'-kinase [Candidatus Omnitrophica bacterium]|nr:tetraacyldisaccharide 4'-kinase [Candidatus Omnitrophota bacterium]
MKLIYRYRLFLAPFSLVYFLVTSIRNILYDIKVLKRFKVNATVISVGNITWGGTGKTPAVLFLIKYFSGQNRKVAALIRGYGQDEPGLLSGSAPDVPVIIGKDRVKTACEAVKKCSADIILLDDGFQHRRLKRDLDIVCIDATNPFGNGFLIPAGSLREGLRGLKRADVFLITKTDLIKDQKSIQDLESKLRCINPDALIARSIHEFQDFYRLSDEQLVDVNFLKNKVKETVIFSGIGNPVSFESTVLNLGLMVKKHFIFRDHHCYTCEDLRRINDYCLKNKIGTVITTEKDAVRLQASSIKHLVSNVLVLRIQLKVTENEQGFYNRLSGICSG